MKQIIFYVLIVFSSCCKSQEVNKRSNILLTGDSRFAIAKADVRASFGAPVFPESGDVFVNHFQLGNRVVSNWGVSGYQITNILTQCPAIVAGKFDKVVIQCGTNDALYTWHLPTYWWDSVMLRLAGVKEVFITEPIYFQDSAIYLTFGSNKNLTYIKNYNDSLRRLTAKYPNAKWIPTNYKMIGTNGYLKPEYSYDKIHQTYAGYLAMMDAFDEIIIY